MTKCLKRLLVAMLSVPTTIDETVNQIKTFALQEFDREVANKQLYYHTREHVHHVQRRAALIFQVVCPDWNLSAIELERLKQVLDLCAIAHDMIQLFQDSTQEHTARKRQAGVSETATLDRLLDYIDQINHHIRTHDPNSAAILTEAETDTIRAAICATVCAYDATEKVIYQPALNNADLPLIARILALADLGAFGIDGIRIYNREGSLLFLEENPDVVSFLEAGTIYQLEQNQPELSENIRQRLLQRCRFQISLAKSRLARFEQETSGFSERAIEQLRHEVFKYLALEALQELEAITPIDDAISLSQLLQFFNFEQCLKANNTVI